MNRDVQARSRKLSQEVPGGGLKEQSVLRSSVLDRSLDHLFGQASGTVLD